MVTIQYVPFEDYGNLNSEEKVRRLLRIVREEKILMLEGRLTPGEEAKLIELTMEQIDKKFKGVEVCTVYPANIRNQDIFDIAKANFYKIVLGKRQGVTIIGPASIIKEIKRDPNKIELLMKNKRK